jgi:hypothetical protein
MMDEKTLTELTREIMAQGYDAKTASNYAVLIGDTPCTDAEGNVLVFDGVHRVAKLKALNFFMPGSDIAVP